MSSTVGFCRTKKCNSREGSDTNDESRCTRVSLSAVVPCKSGIQVNN